MGRKFGIDELAGIQYMGRGGTSRPCLDAIIRLIQFGDKLNEAKLLSCGGDHCILINTNYDDWVAIKSGFTSGYPGQGPHTLSIALQILERHDVEIDEYEVSRDVIGRVDRSCLTLKDLDLLEEARPVRPQQWHDYILDDDIDTEKRDVRLQSYFPKSVPLGLIDSRIVDLALEFPDQPDKAIMSGYRRLEDIVRKRTGLTGEHSAKLFSSAFHKDKDKGVLDWGDIDPGEHVGRTHLFAGAYMAFRNRRAHQEPDPYAGGDLQEFLLLNHLYVLEREAKKSKVEEAADA